MKKTALLALLLAAVLTLAACGARRLELDRRHGQDQRTVQRCPRGVRYRHDPPPRAGRADVADGRSQARSAEVKKLADDIAAAQGPEIDTMTRWLKTGVKTPRRTTWTAGT
jgi:hypothetical protein